MIGLPITLTDAAKERILSVVSQKPGALGISLSLAKGKGCGGYEYKTDYVTEEKAGFDKITVRDGVSLYIPQADSFLMFGMTIDFVQDKLGNAKFEFKNPNEAGRCGCGESVSFPDLKPGK